FVRGHREAFDRWARNGATGWSYEDVLPYFRKLENWAGERAECRGADGPLDVRENAYQDPRNAAFAEALPAYGLPRNPDYNRGDMRGFAPLQQTLRGGRRASAAVAYLKPSLKRPNLKLESGALVERLTIEEGRATGLIYRRGGNL